MISYDPHQWFRRLFYVRGSLIRELGPRMLAFAIWSVVVKVFHAEIYSVSISLTGHTVAGTVLSLLLVFRTNSSYDRFWEGRKLWGGIVNSSRNLMRLASVTLPSRAHLERVSVLVGAFPYALIRGLRGGQGKWGPSEPHWSEGDAKVVKAAPNAAFAVALKISETVAEARKTGQIELFAQLEIDRYVKELVDLQGGCERIVKTPIPFGYAVHLRRTLILFLITLPFALIDSFGWLSPLVLILVAYVMLGVEEIGIEIEDPFGTEPNDLPLEDIAGGIAAMSAHLVPYPERLPEFSPSPSPSSGGSPS